VGEGTRTGKLRLKEKGAEVIGRYFCNGQMALLFSRGHPNLADIDAARKFAREMADR